MKYAGWAATIILMVLQAACGDGPGGIPGPQPYDGPDSIVAQVALPECACAALAISPWGDRIYAAGSEICFVETSTLTLGTPSAAVYVNDVAVSPSGQYLFAPLAGTSTVAVVETSTMSLDTIVSSFGMNPQSICTTRNGVWALAPLPSSGWLAFIDAQEMQLDTAVCLPGQGAGEDACAGQQPYAYALRGETLGKIDITLQEAVDSLYCPGAGGANTLACSPDGSIVAMARTLNNSCMLVALASMQPLAEVELAGSPVASSISPSGEYVAFACREGILTPGPAGLCVVETASPAMVFDLPLPDQSMQPVDLAWSPGSDRIYLLCQTDSTGEVLLVLE